MASPSWAFLKGLARIAYRMHDRSMRWWNTYVTTLSAVGTSALSWTVAKASVCKLPQRRPRIPSTVLAGCRQSEREGMSEPVRGRAVRRFMTIARHGSHVFGCDLGVNGHGLCPFLRTVRRGLHRTSLPSKTRLPERLRDHVCWLRPMAQSRVRYRHIRSFTDAGSVLPVTTDVPNGKFAPVAFFAVGIVAVRSVNANHIDVRDLTTCIA